MNLSGISAFSMGGNCTFSVVAKPTRKQLYRCVYVSTMAKRKKNIRFTLLINNISNNYHYQLYL